MKHVARISETVEHKQCFLGNNRKIIYDNVKARLRSPRAVVCVTDGKTFPFSVNCQ